MALEEILEIFKGVIIKVSFAMEHIILDVFLGERVKEEDLGFFIVKFFFILTIKKFDGTQHIL